MSDFNLSQIVTMRAHNLCRRWRGFMGYDEYGRVASDSGFAKFTGQIDEALKAEYGDAKSPVEREAVIQSKKYSGVVIPEAVKARAMGSK